MTRWLRRLGTGGRGAGSRRSSSCASASACTSTWTATSVRTSAFGRSRAPTTTRSRPSERRSGSRAAGAAPPARRGDATAVRHDRRQARRPRLRHATPAHTGVRRHPAPPPPAAGRRRPGPTIAAPPAMASIASGPSPRRGRPAARACSGSSRSAKATPRSSSPAASPTPSSSGAIARWSPPTTSPPGANAGPTAGTRSSRNRWAAMDRARRRPTPTASSTRSARPASCGRCGPTTAPSSGAPTSSRDAGAENLQWGMSAAPLIVDGKVIVQPGGRGASVVAYDAATRQAGVEGARRHAGLRLARCSSRSPAAARS